MKKFLSVLASLGLVATASMSVVSCTKKDKTPTFKDYRSIKNWNLTGDNEVIPVSDVTKDKIFTKENDKNNKFKGVHVASQGVRDLVIATLANRFKNPEEVYENLKGDDYALVVSKDGDSIQYSEDGKTAISAIYNCAIAKPADSMEDPSKPTTSNSSAFKVKFASNVKELDSNHIVTMPLDNLLRDGSSSYLIATINGLEQEVTNNMGNPSDWNDLISIKSESAELMQMDQRMFEDLADYQSTVSEAPKAEDDSNSTDNSPKMAVPGFDSKHVRYKSINQQIISNYSDKAITEQVKDGFKEYRDVLVKFNKAVLEQMRLQLSTGEKAIKIADLFKSSIINFDKNSFKPFSIGGAN